MPEAWQVKKRSTRPGQSAEKKNSLAELSCSYLSKSSRLLRLGCTRDLPSYQQLTRLAGPDHRNLSQTTPREIPAGNFIRKVPIVQSKMFHRSQFMSLRACRTSMNSVLTPGVQRPLRVGSLSQAPTEPTEPADSHPRHSDQADRTGWDVCPRGRLTGGGRSRRDSLLGSGSCVVSGPHCTCNAAILPDGVRRFLGNP